MPNEIDEYLKNHEGNIRANDGADEDITFSSYTELSTLCAEMVGRSHRQLDIVSRSLEPLVYDTREFIAAVKESVVARRVRVRVVVLDSDTLISRGGSRLVELTIRLSSYMEMRRPGECHLGFNEAMLIADRHGVIHRKHSDRYVGIANFHSPRLAFSLTETFESIWQNAETIASFRRLML